MSNVDEDLIEATIRKVAAAKAAREGGESTDEASEEADETAVEAAIAHAEAERPDEEPSAEAPPPVPAVPTSTHDEDRIMETIRRVQAEKAARESTPAAVSQISAIEPVNPYDDDDSDEPRHAVAEAWIDEEEKSAPPAGLAHIERELAATSRAVAELTHRVDRILALVERLAGSPAARTAPAVQDDDWDDAPQLPRAPIGMTPRPPIFRDPSPMTATAELPVADVEPERIDTRPIPAPLPPIQMESRRGLDLLPRTYRITVEDKRRGVDLVPLHRALLSMEGVKDMSLLSYNNGVAIVQLDTVQELESEQLGEYVGRAMSRPAKVEVHNENTMVVKLADS
jgi:hypothetical protein